MIIIWRMLHGICITKKSFESPLCIKRTILILLTIRRTPNKKIIIAGFQTEVSIPLLEPKKLQVYNDGDKRKTVICSYVQCIYMQIMHILCSLIMHVPIIRLIDISAADMHILPYW